VLVHGNPLATAQGRRFSEGGTDINRLFSGFVEELRAKPGATSIGARSSCDR
jgi:succinylglutamate desuccinylase